MTAQSAKWEARLRELKEFKEEHGHCNVPYKHSGGLGEWVNNQRRAGKKGRPCLNDHRTQKLEELGFQWGILSDRWETRLRELKEFKEEHGHCNVPRKHPGGLGDWMRNQRSAHTKGRQCLDAGQTQKLEELGFQ